jgi:serine O-acetyltransferase
MATITECIRADIARLVKGRPSRLKSLGLVLTNRGLQSIVLYRLSHLLWKRRVPLLPLILTRLAQHLFAVDISYRADLGPGIVIVHGFGLVVGGETIIEGDCCLFHGVTLGDRGSEWVSSNRTDGHPTIEPNVMVGAGAKILGPIRIGRNSVIGANAVVLQDVPPNSIVAGVPGRVVGQRPEPQ